MNVRLLYGLGALALGAGIVLAGGCAKTEDASFGGDEGGAPAPPPPPNNGFDNDAEVEPENVGECADETKQVYVVATDKSLYRFYPDELRFVHVGVLACPTAAGTFSMAIDRHGYAWVEYTDGSLFRVNTFTLTCKATGFKAGQTGFETFGMGYAKNGDTENGETLYVAGNGLGSLDTKTFQLNFLGSLTFGRTELTGLDTGLFAFAVNSGVIAGLNKTNGATEVTYRTSAVNERAAFAFAHWGGDFWIFTGNSTTTVTQYTPSTDTSKVAMANAGILIVGAGSSTCVPTEPTH